MSKNKKLIAGMSKTAMAAVFASTIVSSTAFAAADSIVLNNQGTSLEYGLTNLGKSYLGSLGYGDTSKALYQDYAAKITAGATLTSIHDDKGYYVDYAKLVSAFISSPKTFNLDTATGSAADADKVTPANVSNVTLNPDGTVKVTPVATALTVSSVSAINATTLQVTLSDVPTVAPVTGDFSVTASIDGATAKTITASVTKVDGKVVTISVPEIAATNLDQNITYSISYKSGQSKEVTTVVKQSIQVQSVSNVVSKNAVQVTLQDGADATKAVDKASYTVKVGDTALEVTNVTYIPELKKATLAVDFSGKEGKVSVNSVSAISLIDYKSPDLVSVTPVSDTKFDVKFSEKVTDATAGDSNNYGIVLKGTAAVVPVSTVTKVDDSTYRVAVAASALKEGSTYTVSVKNIVDASANTNTMTNTQTGEFTSIKDTTKPTMVSATALDTNVVEVTMSEELDTTGALPTAVITPYKADGTLDTTNAYTKNVLAADINKNKVTINVDDSHLLVNGKNYKLTISGGQDLSANAIADNQAVDFTGVSDVTAPTVKDSSYDKTTGKLTVNFSEKMVGLGTAANYSVFDRQTGEQQTSAIITPAVNVEGTQVVLTITGLSANNNYSLRVNGLTDASKALNPLKANTIVNFDIPAVVTNVTLNSAVAGVSGNTVAVTFNTALDKAQAENVNNYKIVSSTDETKVLNVTKAVYNSALNTVTLTTDYQAENADHSANYKVTVSGLTNLDTNHTTTTFAGADKVAPTLVSVKSISQNYIDLNFDENIATTQDANGFDIAIIKTGTAEVVGSLTASTPTISLTQVSDKTMRLNLTNALTEGANYTITVKGVKDTFGNFQTNDTAPAIKSVSTSFDAVKDVVAPKLTGITVVNSARLVLKFDEEVAASGAATNYAITDDQNAPLAFAANSTFTVNPDDKTQVIVENRDANGLVDLLENGKNYTLKITGGVTDVAGNTVQSTSPQSLNFVGVKDIVSPKLLSAAASAVKVNDGIYNTKVVLTFDEAVKADSANNTFNTADFVVTNTDTFDTLAIASAKLGTDNKTVELTLSTPTSVGGNYKVYVKGNITDLAVVGNVIDSSNRIALFTGVDTAAPTLTDMQLKGTLGTTATTATVVVSSLDGNNAGTITISGLEDTAKYTTGSVKLSENVGITFDAINNNYDIKTPIQVSKDTDSAALSSLVLTVLGGVDGVTKTQLVNENNSVLTLKDATGNTATYTIVIR